MVTMVMTLEMTLENCVFFFEGFAKFIRPLSDRIVNMSFLILYGIWVLSRQACFCTFLTVPFQALSGFGFITFADPKTVDKVLAEENHELDNKKIDPKVAFPKRAQPKFFWIGFKSCTKCFVKSLIVPQAVMPTCSQNDNRAKLRADSIFLPTLSKPTLKPASL
uniref:RRM domain-containing protein n=1 Tax=Steinernema glaseri TaxID=37863 RepID=A0A1I7YPL7_9BILA